MRFKVIPEFGPDYRACAPNAASTLPHPLFYPSPRHPPWLYFPSTATTYHLPPGDCRTRRPDEAPSRGRHIFHFVAGNSSNAYPLLDVKNVIFQRVHKISYIDDTFGRSVVKYDQRWRVCYCLNLFIFFEIQVVYYM